MGPEIKDGVLLHLIEFSEPLKFLKVHVIVCAVQVGCGGLFATGPGPARVQKLAAAPTRLQFMWAIELLKTHW